MTWLSLTGSEYAIHDGSDGTRWSKHEVHERTSWTYGPKGSRFPTDSPQRPHDAAANCHDGSRPTWKSDATSDELKRHAAAATDEVPKYDAK